MNTPELIGLILCVATVVISAVVLLYDLGLMFCCLPTISRGVWNDLAAWKRGSGRFPKKAVVLPALMTLGAIGLAMHFFL